MLTHLHIRNYALISSLDIDFSSGFSVITGETGAGKSIILGALGLVLGGRADCKVITEGEERCIIEATFDDMIIRRELNQNGRSRSFVNDEVISQTELKKLASHLLDIHSQHENLLISDENYQLNLVDTIAENHDVLAAYEAEFQQYQDVVAQLHEAEALYRKSQSDADYLQYQYEQLSSAHLQAGELQELEEEQYRLSHAEEIKSALQTANQVLDNDEGGVIAMLRSIHIEDAAAELDNRLQSTRIELQDIQHEVERMMDHIEYDPQRLSEVEERIDLINTLLRKHDVSTVEELIALCNRLEQQCQRIDSFDEEIKQLKQEVNQCHARVVEAAATLTQSRQAVSAQIADNLVTGLAKLGVAHPQIEIQITPLPDYTPTGNDDVQILFAANLNQTVRRVSEVASGGEISRLMLCIKALTTSRTGLPTIIFDEIDTGVSGEIATQMAHIMQTMAQYQQVISITHLPQIAARGAQHYRVFKHDTELRTETNICQLDDRQRIEELATMLSGKNPTDAARENAKQLLNRV